MSATFIYCITRGTTCQSFYSLWKAPTREYDNLFFTFSSHPKESEWFNKKGHENLVFIGYVYFF